MTRLERFEAKIAYEPNTGCWLWAGAITLQWGYGYFKIAPNKNEAAHRCAWRFYRGDIPSGFLVCHRCDVPLCVNPEHLFLGTCKDNMQDCANKGRIKTPRESFCSDENHQPAKLSNSQVLEIRASHLNAWQLERTGKYPVRALSIHLAKTGVTFRDVE